MYYYFTLTATRTLIILTIFADVCLFLIISHHESCDIVHLAIWSQFNCSFTPTRLCLYFSNTSPLWICFSSEFQFDCAFWFDGEFDFGFWGDFNFLSTQESEFAGASLGADPFDYNGVSIDYSIKNYVVFSRCRYRRKCWSNRHFQIESVQTSCWYVQFLKPGITHDMTHELSRTNRYGNFCHFFRMPLFNRNTTIRVWAGTKNSCPVGILL